MSDGAAASGIAVAGAARAAAGVLAAGPVQIDVWLVSSRHEFVFTMLLGYLRFIRSATPGY